MKTHKQKSQELERARRAYETTPEAQAVQRERAIAYHHEQIQIAAKALAESEWRLAEAQKTGFGIVTCTQRVEHYRQWKLARETAPLFTTWLGPYPAHLDTYETLAEFKAASKQSLT